MEPTRTPVTLSHVNQVLFYTGPKTHPRGPILGSGDAKQSVADRARQIISFHGTLSDDTHPPYCLGGFVCPLPCSAAEQRCTVQRTLDACVHVGLRCGPCAPPFLAGVDQGSGRSANAHSRGPWSAFLSHRYRYINPGRSGGSWRSGSADVFMSCYLDLEGMVAEGYNLHFAGASVLRAKWLTSR
ncbi:hypothetical protein BC826DRAFT_592751 [Russula brevipes]|nr:hypothetical protein BC826DRAFT_592751 [Russula brevipes]